MQTVISDNKSNSSISRMCTAVLERHKYFRKGLRAVGTLTYDLAGETDLIVSAEQVNNNHRIQRIKVFIDPEYL